ncbi:hypothetical protein PIB30_084871 [Stylosanthes scabra]|uniref:Uncharacterized protein n=1 Tax=Stylosanthes scabra TaxID=79078 RepID=A0ABU6UV23_9FABA|nr:hypothetical protein [Stylosanthes scabra]
MPSALYIRTAHSLPHSHSQFLSSSPILSIPNPSISYTNTHTSSFCVISLTLHRQHDSQKEVNGRKGEGEARHTTHLKIFAIGGVTSLLATNFYQIRVEAEQAIGDVVGIHSKARESSQAPVVEPPKDVKGKRTARGFSKRIIARGGPSRPKPMKNEVIDLVSDEEKEVAEDKKDPKPEEEEEDPEEAFASLTLPSPPKGPCGA